MSTTRRDFVKQSATVSAGVALGGTLAGCGPSSHGTSTGSPAARPLNVRECGAAGDGLTSDHAAFEAAIDRCAAAGGGTVTVPAGVYRVGSLRLCSGLTLRLEAGARLLALDEPDLYPVLATTANRPGVIRALIWADKASDITIEGPGTIDGGGDSPLQGAAAAAQTFRPALVFLRDCNRVRVADASLLHSQFWTLHMLRCSDVTLDRLTIRTHRRRINADGIDPDGCRNVIIRGCDIRTGDDAIVLKSTEGDDCTGVRVSDCVLSSSCAALKIGTESIGRISDVSFRDCRIEDSNIGIAIYMKDGGRYERIAFSSIQIEAGGIFPLIVDVTPRAMDQQTAGSVCGISFDDISIEGQGRCLFEGRPESPLRDVRVHDLVWRLPEPAPPPAGGKPAGAARVQLDPAVVDHTVGTTQFTFVHVDGLSLDRVKLEGDNGIRSLFRLHEVRDARIDGVAAGETDIQSSLPHRNASR